MLSSQVRQNLCGWALCGIVFAHATGAEDLHFQSKSTPEQNVSPTFSARKKYGFANTARLHRMLDLISKFVRDQPGGADMIIKMNQEQVCLPRDAR